MSLKENIRLLTQPHIGYNPAGKIVKQDSLQQENRITHRQWG